MNAAEKGWVMEEKKGCIRCLSWNHQRPACPKRSRPCHEKINGSPCPKSHDSLLHESGSKYCEVNHVRTEVNAAEWHDQRVLLAVEGVDVVVGEETREAQGFWDNGATLCLCTHSWAKSVGLKGKPASIFLKVVHHERERVDSQSYVFEVQTRGGERHVIQAFGVDEISSERRYEPSEELLSEFPEVSVAEVSRRPGKVDFLLGMDVVGLHPTAVRTVGNCHLLTSHRGTRAW